MPSLPPCASATGLMQNLASGYFLATSVRVAVMKLWVSVFDCSAPAAMNRLPSPCGLSRVTLWLSCLRIFQPGALTWKLLVLIVDPPPRGVGVGAAVGVGVGRWVGAGVGAVVVPLGCGT